MTDQPTPQGVKLLKELLFERETRRLDELSRKLEVQAHQALTRDKELGGKIDAVYERAGDDERLQHAVAAIIDQSLKEAGERDHEKLSRSIAPLVVRTIKHQIAESQDDIVDALYPITGRLVKAYVQSAINDMMVEINAKLGGSRPAGQLSEQSAATGLSPGQLALADANKLRVEELFLVRRGSGELVAHWDRADAALPAPAEGRPGGHNRDMLISGYLASIMSLSEEAFGAAPGSFRTITLQTGDRIFVRGSAAHLLAVRCKGSASASVETVIDEVFLEALDRYQRVLATDAARRNSDAGSTLAMPQPPETEVEAILPNVGQSIESLTADRQSKLVGQQIAAQRAAATPSFARLYLMIGLIALPFIAAGLWTAYQSYETTVTETAALRILQSTEDIKGVPPKIDVKRGGRALTLSGFVPNEDMRDQLLKRLAQEIPYAEVRNQLGVLPAGSGPAEIALAELRRQWTAAQELQKVAGVARPLERAVERLGSVRAELVARRASLIAELTRRSQPAGGSALDNLSGAVASLDAALAPLQNARRTLAGATHLDAELPLQIKAAWQKLSFAEDQLKQVMGGPAAHEPLLNQAPSDLDVLADDVAMSIERLGAAQIGLPQALSLQPVPQALTDLAAKFEHLYTAREAFDLLVRSSAIFFDNGIDLKDAAQSSRTLDELTQGLQANRGIVLRVVGFTDEKGSPQLNSNLAQSRATKIAAMLIDRGVPAEQLVAIGRQQSKDLSTSKGPGNVNRRVEFEIGFVGEKGDQ